MELQWQRQVMYWLKLLQAGEHPIRRQTVVPYRGMVHTLQSLHGRAQLTTVAPVQEAARAAESLTKLLSLLMPLPPLGLPMRAWLARQHLWLAVTAPAGCGAEDWHRLTLLQRRLMTRTLGTMPCKN